MLRYRGRRMTAETAADDSTGANKYSGGHVQAGNGQQHKMRVIPNQVDKPAEEDHRAPAGQVDLFEAGIAPGTDHEERKQGQQGEPGSGEYPPLQRRAARDGVDD